MNKKAVSGMMLTLLLIGMLTVASNMQSVKAEPAQNVISDWLTFPVTFDGKMTTAEEWSDTIPVNLTLYERHVGPGTISARVWIKNDDIWLYMLYRVEWPAGDIDLFDGGYIEYFWDWIGCPPSPCWNHSDFSFIEFDGVTLDLYGWNETGWCDDTAASPPGENNVEGAATHDGTYYWFEFRKELNSGDGYDWAFTPGQVIETVSQVHDLLVGVWDDSTRDVYEAYISLHLSTPYAVHNIDTGFGYATIQKAINAPETLDGHTILVDAGTYYENVVVSKSISLVGENKSNTIIDGGGGGTVVQITANNVNISRFTIQNGFWGIDLGFYEDTHNNIVSSNNVVSNQRVGILLGYHTSNNTLRENNVTGSQLNFYPSSYFHDIDPSNTVDGKPIYYLVNQHNQQIPQDAGYVAAVNCTNITVRNVINLQKNLHGILFVNTNQSTIENVTILDNPYGIFLRNSHNNTIYKSSVLGSSEWGVWLWGSGNNLSFNTFDVSCWGGGVIMHRGSENTVNNNIFKHSGGGIRVHSENNVIYHNDFIFNNLFGIGAWYDSSNNSISENNIIASGQGIILQSTVNNSVSRNNIKYNDLAGILLIDTYYNIILENNITNNEHGILLLDNASHNSIYHNNLVNNINQASISYKHWPHGGINVWDDGYPSGGNYWSDYTGADAKSGPNQDQPGSDGIGDTAYVIDADNRDNYPLMNPWTPTPPVVTTTIDINPDTLNLISKGKWITTYIELPEGYNVSDIDFSTVMLNDTIPVSLLDVPAPEPVPTEIGDYDEDGIPDLMVKFNRTQLSEYIVSQGITYGNVTLTITGELYDGTVFEGGDTIRVRMAGDANFDGKVNYQDLFLLARTYGSTTQNLDWYTDPDLNSDGGVNYQDLFILAANYGKEWASP